MGNVPNLRFPEFSGEWKKCTIDDLCEEFKSGKNIKADNILNEGEYPVFGGNGLRGYTDCYNHEGDYVLIGRQGALCGNIRFVTGKTYITEHAIAAKATNNNNTRFLESLFIQLNLGKFSDQSAQPGLAVNKLLKIETSVPSKDEQEKIASLLQNIDKRIATQNKIIEDLKKLKSAIIDKSFCYPNESSPQKRFIGFTEEWHLVHLSDICQRVRTKNFNTQCTLVLTIAAQFGLVSQEEFFNKSVASDNLEGYYLLRKGDFAYNKSYSGDYAWGAVKRLECFSEGVLSPLYICFRPDTARIDSDFLAHYFESKKWYKGIADIAGEGARNHGLLNLSVIDYFKTLHRIPSIQEQKAIANALNKLTSKISIEKNLYDDLLLQRQHLLQQMFI
ncbi:restriction endonuclease subunit S [Parabacteroides johnsonii]|uniref:Type I restriction modification DNA specificity domain-containing protein n=1 Tax=Parabacteroides johnsonii CL02T12C29 TaxID=999419 RepID=K5YI00_9BACT|nr:restriction endonuclease subunit S [Parabacteroides johnsonii]EKN13247.1 hypothetical protein HMPREF1077_00549 [Parabacteroides johnsonii CL02T12C29]